MAPPRADTLARFDRSLTMSWLARACREAVRLIQPLVPRESRGVTILTYHLVGAGTQSVVDLPVEAFRAQLSELREIAHVCSLADAVNRLEEGLVGSRPTVVVTFDDGFDNFRTRAWPLLRELEVPCTFYVPVGFVEGTSATPLREAEGLRPIEWSALRKLASEPLLTIGSHSWSHQDLRFLSVDEVRWDLWHSRERLQDRTGVPVEHFCYPRAKWSLAVEKEVQATYRTAVVAGGRRNVAGRFHPLRLGRIPVRRDMPVRLAPVVQSTVWLEEWAASHARVLT
jgi:peptidoglycan/xylan/chitin deacetylase (PgdA/CDA1 family)